jgi:hypothetical protein
MKKLLTLIMLLTLLACAKTKEQETIYIQALRDTKTTEGDNCIYVKSHVANKCIINCNIDRITSVYGFTEVESSRDVQTTLIVYPQEVELNNTIINISYIKIEGG